MTIPDTGRAGTSSVDFDSADRRLYSHSEGVCVLWCTTVASIVEDDFGLDGMFEKARWAPKYGGCTDRLKYESRTQRTCTASYDGQSKAHANSCAYANNGVCETSSSLCEDGTDVSDCTRSCYQQCPKEGQPSGGPFLCQDWCYAHEKVVRHKTRCTQLRAAMSLPEFLCSFLSLARSKASQRLSTT